MAHIYPQTDPICDSCHQGPGDYLQIFWTCSSLQLFWNSVFRSLSTITSVDTSIPHPQLHFGVLPADNQLPSYLRELKAFLIFSGKVTLFPVKSSYPPTQTNWIKDAIYFKGNQRNLNTLALMEKCKIFINLQF